jgi:subtilisin-like proprotein convertase family protein
MRGPGAVLRRLRDAGPMSGTGLAGLGLTVALVALPGPAAAQYTVKTYTGGPVTVADGAAIPYPGTISGSGPAILGDVTVRLNDVTHEFPDELDVLLAGPGGQSTLLMSDAGGSGPAVNRDLTFSDDAPGPLPDPLVSGTYRPTDIDDLSSDAFPAPAPAGPFATELSVFDRSYSEGTWKLFVVDDTPADGGSISGWRLTLSGRNRALVSSLSPLVTTEGDPIRVTVTRALPPFFGGIPGGEIPLQPAQLSYAVAEGATPDALPAPVATAGTDFLPVSGTLDFAAPDTAKLIETQTVEDHVPEQVEEVRLAFLSRVGDIQPPFPAISFEIRDDDPRAAPPTLAGRRRQRVLRRREIRLRATPNAYGKLRATGRIKLPRSTAARSIALKRVTKSAVAGRAVALRLGIRRRDIGTLRRVLSHRASLTARVTVRLVDLAGGSAVSTRRIKLVR